MGLLALACLATAALSASASTGGHFVSETSHTVVNQTTSGGSHSFEVVLHGSEEIGIVCDKATATGTISASTVTEFEGFTELSECHTTGSETRWSVHMNGCRGKGTIAKNTTNSTEQTNDLICPAGKAIEVTHPNCTITVPPQTNVGGFTYTTILDNNKHAITLDVSLQYNIQYHSGICIFLGTSHTATATGSTIVRGQNTLGEQVGITAT